MSAVPLREAADFLEALLRPATPDSYLELRPLPDNKSLNRAWYRVGDLRQNGFETALPTQLDGKASIYYSVCPRVREGGTAEDVSQATAVWFDEITRPAPDLPPFSWLLETSPGKVQGGYFLDRASHDLDRVERLVKRLAVYVGGDKVYDRARILRMPGFINAKYPDAPRSYLLEFHPDLRYTLESLEALIPVTPGEDGGDHNGRTASSHPRTGAYDPHRGPQLAAADQASLAKFLLGKGLKLGYDGRFSGPCMFHGCDCPSALYISMKTGSYHCFCNTHPGNHRGDVGDLAELGFSPQGPRLLDSSLTWPEIEDAVAQDPQSSYPPEDGNVLKTVRVLYTDNHTFFSTSSPAPAFKPRKKRNTKPSALWDWCCEQIPMPSGRRPRVNSGLWRHRESGKRVTGDTYGDTWFNKCNEAFKKQTILKHLITTFAQHDSFYLHVPADDWEEKKHKAITEAVERAGGRYYAVDNRWSHGYWVYLATAQPHAHPFRPIEDLPQLALDAVKGIKVPDEKPQGKFRPTRGSREFKIVIDEKPADDDSGKLELLATKKGPTDFTLWEANLTEIGRHYEYIDPVFRAMPWQCLEIAADPADDAALYDPILDLAVEMGYQPVRRHRQEAEVAA